MRIGIIDFGTNTIRLDIFEVDGDNYSIIFDNAIFSHIIENTVGNSLSQDGIEYVIQAIEEQQAACRHYRCDKIECFSPPPCAILKMRIPWWSKWRSAPEST